MRRRNHGRTWKWTLLALATFGLVMVATAATTNPTFATVAPSPPLVAVQAHVTSTMDTALSTALPEVSATTPEKVAMAKDIFGANLANTANAPYARPAMALADLENVQTATQILLPQIHVIDVAAANNILTG